MRGEEEENIQGSAKRFLPGFVNSVPAVAYHFCQSFPAAFTRPGRYLLAEPGTQHTFGNIAAVKLDISTMLQLLQADSNLGGVWTDDGLVGCMESCGDVSELSMHFFEREEWPAARTSNQQLASRADTRSELGVRRCV